MVFYQRPNGEVYAGDRLLREDGSWDVEVPPPDPPAVSNLPNWAGLENALRGGDIFGTVYFAAQNVKAFTIMMGCFYSNSSADDVGRLMDFQFSLDQVRAEMLIPLSEDQVSRFNGYLEEFNFPFCLI